MDARTITRAFNGGEVTPEYFGRVDDPKYQSALGLCENFIVLPHGPIQNRPGTTFVNLCADSTKRTRLIPFTYSNDQTMVIEMAEGFFRFHTQGATVVVGSPPTWSAGSYSAGDIVKRTGETGNFQALVDTTDDPVGSPDWYQLSTDYYEVYHAYTEDEVFDVHYVQSGDILTLVHPNHAPRELRRLGALFWTLSDVEFGTPLDAPAAPTVTVTTGGATNLQWYYYVITALDANAENEGPQSLVGSGRNNLDTSGAQNALSWSAVTGAGYYNVYRRLGGLYAFIGQTSSTSFTDDGTVFPDGSVTPPLVSLPFTGANNYPSAVTYFEQRRVFAGTNNAPRDIWLTRSGTESNLNYSLPTRDDDAINFRVASREASTIRHLVPLDSLLLLTDSTEFRTFSVNTDAITPTSFAVRPQSYVGSDNVQPVLVNNGLIYAAARGGHLREMAYRDEAKGYLSGDLSLRAPHLFDFKRVVDLAYQKAPTPIVWAVSSGGDLLGLTYVPEEQVGAWHHHATQNGKFESICVVAEDDIDVAYFVVRRFIGSTPYRMIERMGLRMSGDDLTSAYFVDCGVSYEGEPIDEITGGLDHLEGEDVHVLADGVVYENLTVTGGAITLAEPASVIHVGLPITATIQTLPVAVEIPGYGQGRPKNVNKLWVRTYLTSGIEAGPSADRLRPLKTRTTESPGTPPSLISDEIEVTLDGAWSRGGQTVIRQTLPLPATIVSITQEIEIGG